MELLELSCTAIAEACAIPPEVRLIQEPSDQPVTPEPQPEPPQPTTAANKSPSKPPPPRPPAVQPPPQQHKSSPSATDMFRDMLSQKKHAFLSKLSSIDSEVRVHCSTSKRAFTFRRSSYFKPKKR